MGGLIIESGGERRYEANRKGNSIRFTLDLHLLEQGKDLIKSKARWII
jgi:hypothetical protein